MAEGGRLAACAAGARAAAAIGLVAVVVGTGAVCGMALAALRTVRAELAASEARLAASRADARRAEEVVARIAGEVDRVVRSTADARDRAAALRRAVHLEESHEPGTSPLRPVAGRTTATEPPARVMEQLAWLERETASLDESVALLTALAGDRQRGGSMPSAWPVRGEVSSGFGARSDGDGGEFHPGIDIRAPYGTPVRAAGAGEVVFTGTINGYGNVVVVDHGRDMRTLYGHLSAVWTAPGRRVRTGDLLGAVGTSGRTTGSHLHYEVRVAGQAVDPACHLGGAPTRSARLPIPALTAGG